MVGKLGNIKQVGYELAHHLAGIVAVIIGKRKRLVVLKQLLAHIPFHIGTHHMSLVADVVLAETLDGVHDEKSDTDRQKHLQDGAAVSGEQRVCSGP